MISMLLVIQPLVTDYNVLMDTRCRNTSLVMFSIVNKRSE